LVVSTFGEIEFANTDGGLDFLADDYFVDGRHVRIKVGRTELDDRGREVVWPLASFQLAYTAIGGAWSIERDSLKLRVRDQGINLQRQLQTAVYGGSGGQQGTTDMKGRTLPVCLGRCINISAQQVDPLYLTYQVHDSSVQAIAAVYDSGVAVPFAADYPSYPTLAVASIPAGQHATSIAAGVFRLATPAVGSVTADVDGDNTGADWTATHGTIMRRILTKYSWLNTSDIDHTSFSAFHAIQTHIIGLFLPAGDQSTIEQALERIALSGGAVAGQNRAGLYRVVRLDLPTDLPIVTFTDRNIIDIDRQRPSYGVPFRSWTVENQRNWTVQSGTELAGSVTQSRQRFLEAEVRKSIVEVPDVAEAHPTAASATRASLFHYISNADEEAVRLAEFYSLGRAVYRVRVKSFLFALEIGDTVRIVYPRWNLTQGRNFIVTGISDDANAVVTDVEVFG
jgi:hypothetical protein